MSHLLSVVQVCDFPGNGQGYYRYHEPSRALSRLGVTVVDCDPLHRALPTLAESADVLILQVYDWDWLPLIERRRAQGRASVVEASDYYFDVQPFNPGSLAWADPGQQQCLQHLLAAADAVQTTSRTLRRHWKQWARRVVVFANQLPDVPPLPRRAGPLTVGWAGSGSHLADWYAVAPVVQAWLEAHPDVHLAVMTDECARSFVRLSADRYHFRGLGTLAEYLTFLRTLDVGLAPLLPTEFNRCRSDLKYLEYAAHGVAGIYSDLEPFRETVRRGETGLLFRTADELRHCLDVLAADPTMRERIRQRAHEDSMRRLLRDHVGERLRFYRDLVRSPGVPLPPDLLATAVGDGDYYQLRQGHPERVLAASIERPTDPQTFATLTRLAQEHPTYEPALQQLGHLLNEAGNPGDALIPLDRALGVNPHSCRSLCETARTLAAVGEAPAAQECLERALDLCPAHPVAWKRLLALVDAPPDRPPPPSYALDLAALRLLSDEEALSRLEVLIGSYAPTFGPEERGPAVAAFSQAIQSVARPDASGSLRLLRRAAEAFPESGRIAALLAQALDQAGLRREAQEQYVRVATMARQAELWRQEGMSGDPLVRQCHVAEYAGRHSADEVG